MSRRNYRHTMDALIGKPLYSNLIATPTIGYRDDSSTGTLAATQPTNTASGVRVLETTNLETRATIVPCSAGYEKDINGVCQLIKAPDVVTPPIVPCNAGYEKDVNGVCQLIKVPEVVTPPLPVVIVTPPPVVSSGGGYGGGGGGGASSSAKTSAPVAKPNFIKKNIIPILLAGTAIYVLVKNPIK